MFYYLFMEIFYRILEVINWIVIGISILSFLFQFIMIAFVPLKPKKFPVTEKKSKVAILICAKNESEVIKDTVTQILEGQSYPKDMFDVFVVADNCSDNTATLAKEARATVFIHNDNASKTHRVAYAMKYGIENILKLEQNYDFMIRFDADNLPDKDYISKMNDAFDAYDGKCIITSFRNSKNFGSNIISGLYGVYFTTGCFMEMKGRTVLNCSTRVSGTGYVINSKYLKDGWKYVTLTEDWELTADQIIDGNKIQYCDEAEYFDEQPTTFKVMWRQRVRWSRGHLLVCVTRLKELFRNLFAKKEKHALKVSTYDMIANIMPFGLILTGLTILQVALLLFTPLFVPSMTFGAVVLNWLKNFGMTCLVSYLMTFIGAIVIFIGERKRIQGVSFLKKVALCLIWPFFLAIQLPIDVVALFNKNCGWKVIPHNDTTDFEKLNKVAETVPADVVEDDNTKSEL